MARTPQKEDGDQIHTRRLPALALCGVLSCLLTSCVSTRASVVYTAANGREIEIANADFHNCDDRIDYFLMVTIVGIIPDVLFGFNKLSDTVHITFTNEQLQEAGFSAEELELAATRNAYELEGELNMNYVGQDDYRECKAVVTLNDLKEMLLMDRKWVIAINEGGSLRLSGYLQRRR